MDVPLSIQTERSHTEYPPGAPQPDGALNKETKMKIRHYRQIYADRPDPIVFLPVAVSTSGRIYEDFTRLFSFHTRLVFWPENYLRNLNSFVSSEVDA